MTEAVALVRLELLGPTVVDEVRSWFDSHEAYLSFCRSHCQIWRDSRLDLTMLEVRLVDSSYTTVSESYWHFRADP